MTFPTLGAQEIVDTRFHLGRIGFACRHQRQQGQRGVERHAGMEAAMLALARVVIGEIVLTPTAIAALDALQPGHSPPDRGIVLRDTRGFKAHQYRPGAVNVVGTPPAKPGTVGFLLLTQIGHGAVQHRPEIGALIRQPGEEHEASATDISGRRIQQGAVIGERYVIQVVVRVISIEGTPAAALRLHAGDPVAGAPQGLGEFVAVGLQERMSHYRGIIDVRVVGVFELKRPAAPFDMRTADAPIAGVIGQLLAGQPTHAGHQCRPGLLIPLMLVDFLQRQASKTGIPNG